MPVAGPMPMAVCLGRRIGWRHPPTCTAMASTKGVVVLALKLGRVEWCIPHKVCDLL